MKQVHSFKCVTPVVSTGPSRDDNELTFILLGGSCISLLLRSCKCLGLKGWSSDGCSSGSQVLALRSILHYSDANAIFIFPYEMYYVIDLIDLVSRCL